MYKISILFLQNEQYYYIRIIYSIHIVCVYVYIYIVRIQYVYVQYMYSIIRITDLRKFYLKRKVKMINNMTMIVL